MNGPASSHTLTAATLPRYFRGRNKKNINTLGWCKIWGFHGSDYEECRLLGYRSPVRTSQETHYVSVTGSSPLVLCKIWGFHDGDYEKCRLLVYKNPVRTSQETYYLSAKESSRFILCKIWGFAIFWDVTPCGSWKNRRAEDTYRLYYQGDKNRRARVNVGFLQKQYWITFQKLGIVEVRACHL
jgi:hypothetical protein